MERIHSFVPVYAADAQVLILGSMPGVQSLAQGFYYAHPRNAFWPILAEIFGEKVPQSVAEKVHLVKSHHIALWDSIASCHREGSLDSDIRSAQGNDFAALFAACPHIGRICFNGQTAYKQFAQHSGQFLQGRQGIILPSTSPAHTMKYEHKREKWRDAILHGKGVEV